MVQSVELLLDAASETHIRGEWAQLAAAGLPSQARHTGATNRPHITLAVAGQLAPEQEAAVASAISDALPQPLRLGGLLIFGAGPYVLARAVVPTVHLLRLQHAVAKVVDEFAAPSAHQAPGAWVGHVTLARRLGAAELSAGVSVLSPLADLAAVAADARRWDGVRKLAWTL